MSGNLKLEEGTPYFDAQPLCNHQQDLHLPVSQISENCWADSNRLAALLSSSSIFSCLARSMTS